MMRSRNRLRGARPWRLLSWDCMASRISKGIDRQFGRAAPGGSGWPRSRTIFFVRKAGGKECRRGAARKLVPGYELEHILLVVVATAVRVGLFGVGVRLDEWLADIDKRFINFRQRRRQKKAEQAGRGCSGTARTLATRLPRSASATKALSSRLLGKLDRPSQESPNRVPSPLGSPAVAWGLVVGPKHFDADCLWWRDSSACAARRLVPFGRRVQAVHQFCNYSSRRRPSGRAALKFEPLAEFAVLLVRHLVPIGLRVVYARFMPHTAGRNKREFAGSRRGRWTWTARPVLGFARATNAPR